MMHSEVLLTFAGPGFHEVHITDVNLAALVRNQTGLLQFLCDVRNARARTPII